MKEVILYSVQRALLLYDILSGPVHSVKKNLRKVRTGGGWGGGAQHRYILMMTERKSSRTIESKMRQKTRSVHSTRGKLILYSTATKPIAVCPR